MFLLGAMLFSSVLFAQEWHTDIQEALKKAKEEEKPLILVFQGSDWCAPCIKLDRQVWSTEAFKAYAASHYVMLQADFPRKKKNALPEAQQKKNDALAEKYNPNGYFPFVVILDGEGHVLGNTGHKDLAPQAYIDHLNSFVH